MVLLIGFAWNKAASVAVGINAFESTGIYPLNLYRVPEYFFFTADTSETITSGETAPPNMAPVLVPSTSVIRSESVTCRRRNFVKCSGYNTVFDTFPDEITVSRLLTIGPVLKVSSKL